MSTLDHCYYVKAYFSWESLYDMVSKELLHVDRNLARLTYSSYYCGPIFAMNYWNLYSFYQVKI